MTQFVTDQAIFFVDDDARLREANVQSLDLAGIDVRPFGDAGSALAAIDAGFTGALVTDIRMPRMDGLQLFAKVREIDPEIPVILITGHADVPMAIGALRDGAFEFLTKPFAADHLVASARKALETRRLVLDNRMLRAAADGGGGDSPLIGDSPVMARLRDTIFQVAKADIDVLIEGETGTGKELVAILLHRKGPRRGRPFIALNSGALPEAFAEAELFGHAYDTATARRGERIGRVEASNHGTLFLDEIDSMAMPVQTKLLRVLEEREVLPIGGDAPRPVDLRVVAASKRDLHAAVEAGEFRQDLFYRLNVIRLRIPPLRERRADIPQLFAYFVEAAAEQVGLTSFTMSDAVRRRLIEHDWPGNVRELRNFAFSAVLNLPHPGASISSPETRLPLSDRMDQFEASLLRGALEETGGDIRATMALLHIPRKTLYDKLSRHEIEPNAYRVRTP